MLGTLNETEMESLLKQQVIGRIACYADGGLYIVPVNYVYDGHFIYCHSAMGKKIEMMRKNPKVCFEVDEIRDTFRWKSVITWGRFEEITGVKEKEQAMQRLIHRIMPFSDKPNDHPSHGITENESDIGTQVELILYRIKVEKKTGKFEQ
jgi:nitroimidazol reductase NimA-like FMN-containing flavoprotein (pyridoxamine 5'-phosphate oxidase superfamily)